MGLSASNLVVLSSAMGIHGHTKTVPLPMLPSAQNHGSLTFSRENENLLMGLQYFA